MRKLLLVFCTLFSAFSSAYGMKGDNAIRKKNFFDCGISDEQFFLRNYREPEALKFLDKGPTADETVSFVKAASKLDAELLEQGASKIERRFWIRHMKAVKEGQWPLGFSEEDISEEEFFAEKEKERGLAAKGGRNLFGDERIKRRLAWILAKREWVAKRKKSFSQKKRHDIAATVGYSPVFPFPATTVAAARFLYPKGSPVRVPFGYKPISFEVSTS